MTDIDLTQEEADALIAMPKNRTNDEVVFYPGPGKPVAIPLVSDDKRENFLLDIRRGRIDLGGAPHRNPDGEEIACPHLHVYKEGYGTKWAKPVPPDKFPNAEDLWKTLQDFMGYCNSKWARSMSRTWSKWQRMPPGRRGARLRRRCWKR